MSEETIIISLGGSLIVPDEIDTVFLREFKNLVLSHVVRGRKFIIITGGGKICRKYQEVAVTLDNPTNFNLDWIGIASLKLNAELLRVIFGEYTHEKVVSDLSEDLSFDKPIIIGSALRPGQSSDFNAVLAAKTVGAKKIINLSNIDHIYTADPKLNPDAVRIENISWIDYFALIPKEWNPGLSTPFDPVASRVAKEEGMEVVIMNGKPIDNLAKCLDGEIFSGSRIM